MSRFMLVTAATLAMAVAPAVAQNSELKGQEGGQRPPATAPSTIGKSAPAEKMEPKGPSGAEKYSAPQGQKAAEPGMNEKAGQRAEPRENEKAGQKAEPGMNEKAGQRAEPRTNEETGQRAAPRENSGAQRTGEAAGERGGAANHVNITGEQRSQFMTDFRNSGVREAPRNVHIDNIRVGAPVPHMVTEYWVPVPRIILETVPEWRSYRAVMVGDEVLIIDPATLEIVYVLT